MTELLYLQDSYLQEFSATATSVNGRSIVLDKTCFYPSGGGQPHDTGKLVAADRTYQVMNVEKESNRVVHHVDNDGLHVGSVVHGALDWNRRYLLMRYHTAMHILTEVIERSTGALVTGNQIDVHGSRVDVSLQEFTKEKVNAYVNETNALLLQDHSVSIAFLSREEALADPTLFKLKKGFPEHIQTVRVVSIGSINRQADGGTHVRSTKEVGQIMLGAIENKGKERKRIYFILR